MEYSVSGTPRSKITDGLGPTLRDKRIYHGALVSGCNDEMKERISSRHGYELDIPQQISIRGRPQLKLSRGTV